MADSVDGPHEAGLLMLDPSKAKEKLGWRPVWDTETAIRKTVGWYKAYYEKKLVLTESDWHDYVQEAGRQGIVWFGA